MKTQRREQRNSSTLSLTSALDVQRHVSAFLPPGNKKDAHFMGGLQGQYGRLQKTSLLPGFDL
jgi:hypothetical protein